MPHHLDDGLLDDLVAVGEPAVVDRAVPHARIEVAEKLGHGVGVLPGDERRKGHVHVELGQRRGQRVVDLGRILHVQTEAPADVVVVEPLVRTDLFQDPAERLLLPLAGNRFETPGLGAVLGFGEVDAAHVIEHVVHVTRILFGDLVVECLAVLGRGIVGDPLVEMRRDILQVLDTVLAGFQRVVAQILLQGRGIVTAGHLLLAVAVHGIAGLLVHPRFERLGLLAGALVARQVRVEPLDDVVIVLAQLGRASASRPCRSAAPRS